MIPSFPPLVGHCRGRATYLAGAWMIFPSCHRIWTSASTGKSDALALHLIAGPPGGCKCMHGAMPLLRCKLCHSRTPLNVCYCTTRSPTGPLLFPCRLHPAFLENMFAGHGTSGHTLCQKAIWRHGLQQAATAAFGWLLRCSRGTCDPPELPCWRACTAALPTTLPIHNCQPYARPVLMWIPTVPTAAVTQSCPAACVARRSL